MGPNGYGRQDNHRAGQGFDPLPALAGEIATRRHNDGLAPSDVMELAFEVTRTSAEIYELVGGLAGSLAEPPEGGSPTIHPPLQRHLASLLMIMAATQESENRVRRLESKIIGTQPEILDAFLEDCWAALVIFKEAGVNLAGIIDGSTSPAVTATETLIQIMKRLETCTIKVLGLPGTGIAVSYQCLAETAFNLQRQAGDLVIKPFGSP